MSSNGQVHVSVNRFVPQGKASLTEDAPGWHGETTNNETSPQTGDNDNSTTTRQQQQQQKQQPRGGPICWKCRGTGQKPQKPGKVGQPPTRKKIACSVCQGAGKLPARAAVQQNATGVIPRARRTPNDWIPAPPLAHALQQGKEGEQWRNLVILADSGQDIKMCNLDKSSKAPEWLPRHGEQLCKLNGSWRILQKVGGHRWTTDDCVTAYVAAREAILQFPPQRHQGHLRYLDLGTGNGSVLQMVIRALLQEKFEISEAKGIEARTEAVGLARRSLLFNVGPDFPVKIIHGDFRDVVIDDSSTNMRNFDLVTGTPPYFRVDFHVKGGEQVTSAVIRQGGMPTALQSAPARCEFRGGIEAYCTAAARVLAPDSGRFVVCENFLNHERVLKAASAADLQILRTVKVQGRVGRKPLFCVYVMMCKPVATTEDTPSLAHLEAQEVLAVRDDQGDWTQDYVDKVFRTLSIPPFSPSAK